MDEDEDLMASIRKQAAKARDAAPAMFDVQGLARELHHLHSHRPEREIADKIKDVFRAEGLHWI